LSNIELAINRGEFVGIVGPTGCGKSTLIKAALGLQADFLGEVRVFGSQLRALSKELLAERICYLPQEPFIMAGTLRDNLQILRRHASDDELRQALSSASAAETTWALGLDTLIHEGGRNLSGGQRQRLSLARAFLSKADLYLVDEATSQLDAVTEERVTQALMLHCAGKTVITIAHRLKALAMVSRVLVLEHGKIVQDGPFDSLAAQPGLFANLLRATDLDIDAKRNDADRFGALALLE
jgi:ABC-type multidrug transport system fused ATPase/permease subunit